MKLTIIGGGGFRVPQIVQALSKRPVEQINVETICLYDVSSDRLNVMLQVLEDLDVTVKPSFQTTTDIVEAITGADFIFSAMRVGGTCGRVLDEKIALENDVLGQETVGPGGYAYAFRTLPEAMEIARVVAKHAPNAWVINFTNPAGIITQGMRAVMGDRVIGICDTPIGLVRRAGRALGLDEEEFEYDYIGLNHLGWLRSIKVDGEEKLPELLASDQRIDHIEEARIIGIDWVRQLAMIPNEYMFYYYRNREAVAQIRHEEMTRGQFLSQQQESFYQSAKLSPEKSGALWNAAHDEREATYMAEARTVAEEGDRHEEDLEGGGYQEVALNLMAALANGFSSKMILGVANRGKHYGPIIPSLSDEAVVEVPCLVDKEGLHPLEVSPLEGAELGLVTQVKACENKVIEAVMHHDKGLAWQALALHPLVDSVEVAKKMLEEYCEQNLQIRAVFS